jgi:hypothetical protein
MGEVIARSRSPVGAEPIRLVALARTRRLRHEVRKPICESHSRLSNEKTTAHELSIRLLRPQTTFSGLACLRAFASELAKP